MAVLAAAQAAGAGLFSNQESRLCAMVWVAVHDALNSIQRRFAPYLTDTLAAGAHPAAAAAQATHDVLLAIVPSQSALVNQQLAAILGGITAGAAKDDGIAIGTRCAQAVVTARTGDGAAQADVTWPDGTAPGQYRSIPNVLARGVYSRWGQVRPFVIPDATALRAPPPDALASAAYATDFNEVKSVGTINSSTRTADQTEIGRFWLENCPPAWNRLARERAVAQALDGWQQARLYALVHVAMCDALIVNFESKYHYAFWRPVTAIRSAETDGNSVTVADTNWLPFTPTPPTPDYTSAHAAAGGAAEVVLADLLGGDAQAFTLTSDSLPGARRSYTRFSQAALENAESRIYVGFHFRRAVLLGLDQGRAVGRAVLAGGFRPV